MLLIPLQLHLINLSNEFDALCPNAASEQQQSTTVNILAIISISAAEGVQSTSLTRSR